MYWLQYLRLRKTSLGKHLAQFLLREFFRGESMIIGNLKTKILLAALCCFALVLMIPVPSSAQLGGVAKGVQHGVQQGAEKTKEGAEAVGHETKKVITGEDNSQTEQTTTQQNEQNTTTQQQPTTDQNTTRMKPSETTPETGSTETEQKTERTGQKQMPRTAGELPLLALAGSLSLAFAGVTSLKARSRRSHS
jgi:hypothetical protein